MLARFCDVQRKYSHLCPKTTTAIACRTGSCVATQASGWIAFLGVFRSRNMAGVRTGRFAGLVRIWAKTGRFLVQIRTKPQTAGIVPPPYHGYGKHPKRQSTLL